MKTYQSPLKTIAWLLKPHDDLVAKVGELGLDFVIHAGIPLRFRQLSPCRLLPLIIRSTLDFSPLLQSAIR